MKILILTDIYGQSVIPQKLREQDCVVYEPYEIDESITDETQLYENFLEQCGHEKYFQQAYEKLLEVKPDIIIGFSIGGSVAWRLTQCEIASKIICFYPSQIRNHLDIDPKVHTTVILPDKEPHFCIEGLRKELLHKKNTDVISSQASHGFANFKSKNYNQQEADKYYVNLIGK